ncbi:DUF3037 domain-containing protein [Marinobacter sp. LV10MA510-1]|uniref:DUF3037 domain-containing protein n=1 Tax=Marinobacter sp. LV10MA510-1 TaxID=1415567 RepID=UPI000C0136E6|nr:DUF3037 domain-containing protein [Marinobacter sp. LV10MA510-1]PFG10313.1 Protein of unknown function (DUF3037) [Marinobacter sp. LV10MA510-1]
MTRFACHYAIVRFMPYIETGEFANVGVLLWIPKTRHLSFKLLRRKYARITQFFEELDKAVYLKTMANIEAELLRIQSMLLHNTTTEFSSQGMEYGFHKGIFDELIRPRETIARFSERRSILSEDPQKTLQELFNYYVGRNFVTREYQETVLEKGIKKLLEQSNLARHFSKRKVEDHLYSVTFPFVEQDDNKTTKVIKPLFLGQADSTAIIEHGDHWKLKVNQLRKRNLLHGPVLFPVKGPEDVSPADIRFQAFEEARDSLADDAIEVVLYTEKARILEFAAH